MPIETPETLQLSRRPKRNVLFFFELRLPKSRMTVVPRLTRTLHETVR